MPYSRLLWQTICFCLLGLPFGFCCLVTEAEQPAGALSKEDAWLAKISELGQNGEVDQLIEQVVHNWQPSRKDKAWKILGKLACDLIDWENRTYQTVNLNTLMGQGQKAPPNADFGGLKFAIPREVATREFVNSPPGEFHLLVRAEKIFFRFGSSPRGFYISSGSIQGSQRASFPTGVFFANGDLDPAGPDIAVIVCDGEFRGSAHRSLIIARKGVEYWNVGGSVILSGGPVRSHYKTTCQIGHSTIISASTIEVPKGAQVINSVFKKNQPNALGPVKFFDPAQVGIEVKAANNAVRIKNLDPAKSFAKAGLQAGDVLLALNKSPVKSVEGFRKQLRHSLAVQTQSSFEVRRGEKTVTISVNNLE